MVLRRLAIAAALLGPAYLAMIAVAAGERMVRAPAQATGLTVVFSGELNGHLAPCGCSTPMLGGLPRRATWLRRVDSAGAAIRLENGDLTAGQGRQDEMKAETVVDILSALKYDVIVPGERDFGLGLAFLESLRQRFHGAMLCAGARGSDGKLLFREVVTVTRRMRGRPVRVAVVGLMSQSLAASACERSPAIRFEAPEATLARLAPRIRDAGTIRILVLHGRRADAEALVRRCALFDLVVFAHDGEPDTQPVQVGRASIVSCGENGTQVGVAVLPKQRGAGTTAVRAVALGPEYGDDPSIAPMRQAYLERMVAEDLMGQVPRLPTSNGDAYAGNTACRGCHADAYSVWAASGHSHALAALAAVKEDRDPECAACHVVGLDRVGGYVSVERTPDLANVGCESCHGPAARHARKPSESLPKAGEAACGGCHVPQNSPRFGFASYWPRIRH